MAEPPPSTSTPHTSTEGVVRALAAEGEIKSYTMATIAASVVPVPLFDIAAITAIQARMIQKLSHLYGQEFSEHAVRNTVTALAGGALGYGVGATVALSMFKLVPGIGWIVGSATMPIITGATTYAIGRVYAKHFESGGSVATLRAEAMRSYYKEQLQKGKELAAGLAAKAKAKREAATEGTTSTTASTAV